MRELQGSSNLRYCIDLSQDYARRIPPSPPDQRFWWSPHRPSPDQSRFPPPSISCREGPTTVADKSKPSLWSNCPRNTKFAGGFRRRELNPQVQRWGNWAVGRLRPNPAGNLWQMTSPTSLSSNFWTESGCRRSWKVVHCKSGAKDFIVMRGIFKITRKTRRCYRLTMASPKINSLAITPWL